MINVTEKNGLNFHIQKDLMQDGSTLVIIRVDGNSFNFKNDLKLNGFIWSANDKKWFAISTLPKCNINKALKYAGAK